LGDRLPSRDRLISTWRYNLDAIIAGLRGFTPIRSQVPGPDLNKSGCGRDKCSTRRLGRKLAQEMVTPPKIPAARGRPARTLGIAAWAILFGAVAVVGALFLPPLSRDVPQAKSVQPSEPPLSPANAGDTCLRLAEDPKEYVGDEVLRRRWELHRLSCKMAFATLPENAQFKVAAARNMPISQRAESLVLLREAAAQGNAEANYEIYESHKSWDRGDLDKVSLVSRGEADQALHRAAEFGHPYSTQMLAILLDRGTTVKRDPATCRNVDRGRRRSGRPEAGVVPVAGSLRQRGGQGCAGAALSGRQTGAP
jgi:hypothetical protein